MLGTSSTRHQLEAKTRHQLEANALLVASVTGREPAQEPSDAQESPDQSRTPIINTMRSSLEENAPKTPAKRAMSTETIIVTEIEPAQHWDGAKEKQDDLNLIKMLNKISYNLFLSLF